MENKVNMVRAFYFENDAYNGVLVTCGNLSIEFADMCDGVQIDRDHMATLTTEMQMEFADEDGFNCWWDDSKVRANNFCSDDIEAATDLIRSSNYIKELYNEGELIRKLNNLR